MENQILFIVIPPATSVQLPQVFFEEEYEEAKQAFDQLLIEFNQKHDAVWSNVTPLIQSTGVYDIGQNLTYGCSIHTENVVEPIRLIKIERKNRNPEVCQFTQREKN